MRKLLFAVMLLPALLLPACSKEVKEPSADVIAAEDAFAVAEGLREAYVARDFRDMAKYATEEAYEDITRNLKEFRSVELEFKPRWVEIKEDGDVHLYMAWKGTWTMKDAGEERTGMALFELSGRPPKVSRILRQSPFSQPE